MSVESSISALLRAAFNPEHLEVINESHMHSVPPNSDTHFKVVLVTEVFENLNKVKCHQAIYATLADYMRNPIHALALHTFSPAEWAANNSVMDSPDCMGGSKKG